MQAYPFADESNERLHLVQINKLNIKRSTEFRNHSYSKLRSLQALARIHGQKFIYFLIHSRHDLPGNNLCEEVCNLSSFEHTQKKFDVFFVFILLFYFWLVGSVQLFTFHLLRFEMNGGEMRAKCCVSIHKWRINAVGIAFVFHSSNTLIDYKSFFNAIHWADNNDDNCFRGYLTWQQSSIFSVHHFCIVYFKFVCCFIMRILYCIMRVDRMTSVALYSTLKYRIPNEAALFQLI